MKIILPWWPYSAWNKTTRKLLLLSSLRSSIKIVKTFGSVQHLIIITLSWSLIFHCHKKLFMLIDWTSDKKPLSSRLLLLVHFESYANPTCLWIYRDYATIRAWHFLTNGNLKTFLQCLGYSSLVLAQNDVSVLIVWVVVLTEIKKEKGQTLILLMIS